MLNLSSYPYTTNETFLDYEFESSGPRGVIKKVANFSKVGPAIFNFGFGDLDEKTGKINDTITSNNGDDEKILATLASIINEFTTMHPNFTILIQGSTSSRTRRYQMGIGKYWDKISIAFDVFGLVNDKWKPFVIGQNYTAFFGKRKTSNPDKVQ